MAGDGKKDGVGPAELFPALHWAGQFVSELAQGGI